MRATEQSKVHATSVCAWHGWCTDRGAMSTPDPKSTPSTRRSDWLWDVRAAVAVTLISVPQGVAYALIAGLPPAMGLYAGALPAIVGALTRSSRLVVTGPSNAVSLLVGTSLAAQAPDPVSAAVTLALLVGIIQVAAGLLRLGAVVDYISSSVVLGYITGAGTLIGMGQLANTTRTKAVGENLFARAWDWVGTVPDAHPLTVGIALGSTAFILLLRRLGAPKGTGAIATIGLGTLAAWALGLDRAGVVLIRDLAPIPGGLPSLSIPDLSIAAGLVPVAIATAVLSLVESTSPVDVGREFIGQGLANLTAGLSGAYPVSGSLARSALNERVGARTRAAGALTGVFMLGVLLGLGPVVDWIPIPSLAGLLLVVAADLIDVGRIRRVLRSGLGDAGAFLGTVLGTWTLPLDQAIYVGVGISLVLFLRRARLLVARELLVDGDLHLQEAELDRVSTRLQHCERVRVLHIEGPLFFGVAPELDEMLRAVVRGGEVKVVILRLKRAQGLDLTTAMVLVDAHRRMEEAGGTLMLVGLREGMVERLRDMGLEKVFGDDLYPTEPEWFAAMSAALDDALDLVEDHPCDPCPLVRYRDNRRDESQDSSK